MHYDILAQIKNATNAGNEKITIPFSKMDFAVLTALASGGYVKGVEKEAVGRKNFITARIIYKDKRGAMNDFKIVSKPSRHFYMDYRSIRPVKQGHGIGVISTSKGIMTDKEARRQKVGGEYLFEIW